MTDISSWNFYFKIDPEYNSRVGNNMLYTPYIQENTMCMYWDSKSLYQKYHIRPYFTDELLDFFFNREVENLNRFKSYSWCPQIYNIDLEQRKIFIEFPGETLNDILYTNGRSLTDLVPDYEEQIFNIIKDIHDAGYYKMSLYPHCFFISNGIIKTFDFYACISRAYPYIEKQRLMGMMGEDSAGRFSEAIEDNKVNFEIFFKRLLNTHVKWPNNLFPRIYERLYGLV